MTEVTQQFKEELVSLPIDQIKVAMEGSLDALACIALPDEFDRPFSDAHRIMWKMMISSVKKGYADKAIIDKFALGLPRGHAKTTMLKLLCLYTILFTQRRFILVLCSNFKKASGFIEDVTMLLDSDNIVKLFGRWSIDVEKDNEQKKKFTFQGRMIIMKPQGIGGSVRGINEAFRRPDLIICDDIQEREDAKKPEQAEALLEWFLATLMKARNLRLCTFVFLGNMYKDLEIGKQGSGIYCCLLRNLQLNPEWTSMIVGAILSDGTALWEEVVSLDSLLSDLRQDTALGKSEVFYAESQNDPSVKMSKFYNPAKVEPPPYNEYDTVIGKYLMIDPSLGTRKSDDQPVGLFHVYDSKGPVFKEVRVIQKSAPELVREVLEWAIEDNIPLICSEAAGYQGSLLQWFMFWAETLQIEGLQFAPISPKGMSKASRILAYFKSLQNPITVTRSMLDFETVKPLLDNQASFYEPTNAKAQDDLLDLGAYGEQIFLELSCEYILPIEAVYDKIPDTGVNEQLPELLPNVTTY